MNCIHVIYIYIYILYMCMCVSIYVCTYIYIYIYILYNYVIYRTMCIVYCTVYRYRPGRSLFDVCVCVFVCVCVCVYDLAQGRREISQRSKKDLPLHLHLSKLGRLGWRQQLISGSQRINLAIQISVQIYIYIYMHKYMCM